jgi:uncharacterized protein YcbK (DUF882 family)
MVRHRAGIPFIINSGYRCIDHNEAVRGYPNSAHLRGLAADIRCMYSWQRFKIVSAAFDIGITRVGVYDTFIHIDVDSQLPANVMWRR